MAEDYVFGVNRVFVTIIKNCSKGIILSGVPECFSLVCCRCCWASCLLVIAVSFFPFPCVCVCLCFIIIVVLSYVLFSFCFHFMPYFSGLYDVRLCYGSAEFIIICFLFFYFYLGFSFCFFCFANFRHH